MIEEIENVYKNTVQGVKKNAVKLKPKEDFDSRIEKIEGKFEKIAKENKMLKDMVIDKSHDISEMKQVISSFQKELKDIKDNKLIHKGILTKKPKRSVDLSKNYNIFKKKNCVVNDNKKTVVNSASVSIKLNNDSKKRKEESSASAQFSSPDKNLKNSTTATNKTITKNQVLDDLLGKRKNNFRWMLHL